MMHIGENIIMSRFDRMIEIELSSRINSLNNAAIDPSYWALTNLGIDLYDNQIEICNAVVDLSVQYLAILQARGGGKSFSAALGLIKLCLDTPGFRIGIFGPKAGQAERLLKEEILGRIITPSSKVYDQVDWQRTSAARITFANGSSIKALSASETAQQEGEHFHVIVCDEAHQISDWVLRERLAPMLGSFSVSKMIKIGIPMYKNNFWLSCNSPTSKYLVLKRSWRDCPIFFVQGSIEYEGVEYPRRIVDLMPRSVKLKIFPNEPKLHYDSVEGYSEIEWNTQYEMIWMDDINLALSERHQKLLVSGKFDILEEGRPELTEKYFFGLDTASGSIIPGKKDLDWTVLSIWRKNQDNVKQCVARYAWQGDVIQQVEEIKTIVHPVHGVFQCVFGFADYSNIAIGLVESFKAEKIPIEGIMFNATEPNTHKNYKNAMVDQFIFELESDRIQYPSLEVTENNKLYNEAYFQWCSLERHKKTGINDLIAVPESVGHDDHCMSDVLGAFAADRFQNYKHIVNTMRSIPKPQIGPSNMAGGTIPMPGYDSPNESKYLKGR